MPLVGDPPHSAGPLPEEPVEKRTARIPRLAYRSAAGPSAEASPWTRPHPQTYVHSPARWQTAKHLPAKSTPAHERRWLPAPARARPQAAAYLSEVVLGATRPMRVPEGQQPHPGDAGPAKPSPRPPECLAGKR